MNADEIVRTARELCEKATPGPWKVNQLDDCFVEPRICEIPANGCYDYKMFEANSMLIAKSRTLVPELCDLIESMQAQLAEYEALAAEYGIDGQTMLTLAKSQIATAADNVKLMEQLTASQRRERAMVEFAINTERDFTECDKMFVHICWLRQETGFNLYLVDAKQSGAKPLTFEQYLRGWMDAEKGAAE